MTHTPSRASAAWQFLLSTLIGVVSGGAVIAAYAYGTSEWWLTGRVAQYCALALVPLATALVAVVTGAWVGRRAAQGRTDSTHPVLMAGLLVFALASVVRVYPLRELTAQLPGYLDSSPSLSRVFKDLEHAELPLLSHSLGQTFSLVYMIVEALVLFGALVLIARWSINTPYCYTCRRYCLRKTDVARFVTAPLVEVLNHMKSRNWTYFRGLGPPPENSEEWLRMDVATCPECQRTNTLSLQLMSNHGRRRDSLVLDAKITQDDLRTVQGLN